MLNVVGGLLVLGGCLVWGFRAADDLSGRVRILEDLIGAVRVLERELALFRPALLQLLACMAQGRMSKVREFFDACCNTVEAGGGFVAVWDEEVDKLPLTQQEKQLMRALGQVLGRYDDRGQVQVAERIREELEACAAQARQNNQIRGKLYRTLGATAGGFLLLTLL